jgi:hypothetical protein
MGMFIFLSFVSTISFNSPPLSCTFPKSFVNQRLGFQSGHRSNLLPFRLRERSTLRGVQGAVSVLDKMFKDFSSGISDMLSGVNANDVAELRGALGDAEFSAVKATIAKLMAKQREETRELQNRNLEQARQMQRELNQYSNKVRDLEFQLIVAATEVTDLEEQISAQKAGERIPRFIASRF